MHEQVTLDVLHRQKVDATGLLDGVKRDDAGVVQPGCCPRLALEPLEAHGVLRQLRWQDLARHTAGERGVVSEVDLAHSTRTERTFEAIMTQLSRRHRSR